MNDLGAFKRQHNAAFFRYIEARLGHGNAAGGADVRFEFFGVERELIQIDAADTRLFLTAANTDNTGKRHVRVGQGLADFGFHGGVAAVFLRRTLFRIQHDPCHAGILRR